MSLKRWGCLYIQDKFQFTERDDLAINIEYEFESIFIEINNLPHKLILGEIYRVPGTNEHSSIDRYDCILQKLSNYKGEVFLATDQNLNYINAGTRKHPPTIQYVHHRRIYTNYY